MGFAYSALPPISGPDNSGQNDFSRLGPTWHYRHVALCLNERKTLLGIATGLSALPTEIRDDAITYTEINLARAMIKAMCVGTSVQYFKKAFSTTTLISPYVTISSVADLLSYCGLAQSSWMNVLYGVVSYQENMQAGSTLVLKCIHELQLVTSKMVNIYRYPGATGVPGEPIQIQKGIFYDATSNASWTTFCNNSKSSSPTNISTDTVTYQIQGSYENVITNTYSGLFWVPLNGQTSTVHYAGMPNIPHIIRIPIFLEHGTGADHKYNFDFLGLGVDASIQSRYYVFYTGTKTTSTSETILLHFPTVSEVINPPAPTSPATELWRAGSFYGTALVEYTFANDAQLYRNSY